MMNTSTIIKAMVLTWYEMGARIDDVRYDQITGDPILFLSVPEHSYNIHTNGVEMAGMTLAKRIRDTGISTLSWAFGFNVIFKVKAKIRKGETWTKSDCEIAKREGLRAIRQIDILNMFGDLN